MFISFSMENIYHIKGRKYELKNGEETPFNPNKMYVYLNGEMFMPVESEKEFHDILRRKGLVGLIDGD